MKFLKYGMVAAAVALAQPVLAADANLATYDESAAGQLTIYVGGATAQDPNFEKFFFLNEANAGLCTNGTLFAYRANPDVNGDIPQRLLFCTGNPAIASVAGKQIAIHKGSTGGSGNGVGPLVRPASLTIPLWDIAVGGGSMTCTTSTPVAATGTTAAYTVKTGCTNVTFNTSAARPLEAGISDIEPGRFFANFTPNLTSTELGTLTVSQVAGVIFGVPVGLKVRDKLQALTFGAGDPCVGSETLACQPSLTGKQLAAIYSGTYTNWTSLISRTATTLSATNANSVLGAFADPGIRVCRRSNTSGTQAVFQTHFLKQNCGISNSATFRAIGGNVISNGGSPAVVSCLETQDAANLGAIGIISTEFQPSAGSTWRFIKVDGVPPCLLDSIRSTYSLVGEATIQWRSTLAAAKVAALTDIRNRLRSKDAAQDINNNTVQLEMCKPGLGAIDRGKGALVAPFAANVAASPKSPFCAAAGCAAAPYNGTGGSNDVQAFPVALASHNNGTPSSCSAFRDVGPTETTLNTAAVE